MGRIRTVFIKKIGKEIYSANKSKFSKDFEKNKKIVEEMADIPSKQLRNRLAGYITMLAKKEQEWFIWQTLITILTLYL